MATKVGTSVDELVARSQIQQLLARYARGVDRADWPLVRACYHADAHDDHGLYQGGVDGLMAFLQATAAHFVATTHLLGQIVLDIDGEQARGETVCLTWYRRRDREGRERSIAQGLRYLDRFERREGSWAIAQRIVVLDWEQVFEAAAGAPPAAGWQRGVRGSADASHAFFAATPSSNVTNAPPFSTPEENRP